MSHWRNKNVSEVLKKSDIIENNLRKRTSKYSWSYSLQYCSNIVIIVIIAITINVSNIVITILLTKYFPCKNF